jgi:L-lactate dehydrogenase complex protein LldG
MATDNNRAASVDAKAEILARIRSANHGATTLPAASSDWNQIPRTYKSTPALATDARLHLLIDRLRDYDADVDCITREQVPSAISKALAARSHPTMLVPPGFPADLLPADNEITTDAGFTAAELDHFHGILTQATLAIAETGTIVLQNVLGQGRRAATLVPDFHLCIVHADDIVETVPEAVRRLARTANLPTTFISGPSATADIEMTRIKGVHGPRFLHVLLVTPASQASSI